MKQSFRPSSSIVRSFVACLLSFTILIMPIAAVAAPRSGTSPTVREGSATKPKKAISTEEDLFVNPPNTLTAPALPGPQPQPAPQPLAPPPVGSDVTATLAATLAGGDADSDGKADPGDTISYTATLTSSGAGATGLSFSNPLDSHTTLVPGSLNSTPVAFDQTVTTNEDTGVSITIQGQDPDGSNLTFNNIVGPSHGSLGAFSAPSCDVAGVCSSTATYTPAADFNGSDSFSFKVNDGTSDSNQNGAVSITINAVNDRPTFTTTGNPAAVNEDAGAQSVTNFLTAVRPGNATDTLENGQTVSFVVTNNTNTGLFSTPPALNVVGASYPKTATLTYTSAPNQNGTATITYHAHDDGGTANGGVDISADQTFTITVNAVNDPPVVVAPAAYSATANMKVTGLTGLLGNVNDNADNGVNGCVSTTFTVTSGSISATTPAGGTISNVNLNTGTFDFDPPPGVTGDVTFTYTVSDTGCGSGTPAISSPVTTVHVTVSGPVIWFVNLGAGVNGDGRLSSPFNSLASANTKLGNLGATDRIFLYSTTAATTAALNDVVLLNGGQGLYGQGAIGASFEAVLGVSPPANTITRPSIGGTRPTVRGTVTMKNNTVVNGVNIDVSAAVAGSKGLTSAGFTSGTSTVSDVNVTSTTGNAVDFSGTQTVTYTTSNASTSPNILSSTTGTALSVVNTTIGAAGLTFKSISSSGGSSDGIILDTTGSSGGLTVTGDGTNVSVGGNSSGGTIANKSGSNASRTTGIGIYLNSTKNVVLRRMTINGTNQNFGIRGFSVNGFTLEYSTVGGTNGAGIFNTFPDDSGEGSVYFGNTVTTGIIGSGTFTNNNISGGAWDNMHIENTSGTATITVKGNTFGLNGTLANGANISMSMMARNSGTVMNAVVGGSAAGEPNTYTGAPGGLANFTGQQGTTMDVQFKNNIMSNSHPNNNVGGGCLTLASGGTMTFNADGNSMRDANGSTITIQKSDPLPNNTVSTSLSGRLTNNTLGVTGVVDSASKTGNGMFLSCAGKGTVALTITGNTIRNWHNNAAMFFDNTGGSYAVNLTIQSNIMAEPGTGSFASLALTNGANLSSDTVNVCAVIGGAGALKNAITGTAGNAPIFLSSSGQNGGHTFNLPGYVGASNLANVATFVTGNNTFSGGANVQTNDDNSGQGSFTGTGTNCGTPLMLARGGVESGLDDLFIPSHSGLLQNIETQSAGSFAGLNHFSFSKNIFADDLRAHVFTSSSVITPALEQPQIDSIVAAAIERWTAVGLNQKQTSTLRGIKFELADLGGSYLAEAGGSRIVLDRNAAGRGWFISSNPLDDSSFAHATSATRFYTDPTSAPAGHVDLLTAIMHEMGHKLGLDDSYAEKDRDNLMYGYLTVGERRIPSKGQAASATPGQYTGAHFLSLLPSVETPVSPVRASVKVERAAIVEARATINPVSIFAGASASVSGARSVNEKEVRGQKAAIRDQRSEVRSQRSGVKANHAASAEIRSQRSEVRNHATTASVPFEPTPIGSFPINGTGTGQGFKLPAGKTTTITFKATLNAPPNLTGVPPATPKVSAQGTLSGSFIGNPVVTDDPSVGGTTDPTVTNVDLYDSTTTVTSSSNPSNTGQSVTFTAAIGTSGTPSGSGTNRTGTVNFKDGGVTISGCGAQTVGAVTVNQATCTTSGLTTGGHTITADYSGDGNFDPSSGSLNTNPQVVSQSGTSVTLISSLNPAFVTQNITFTATVTSTGGFAGPPTGTVTFKDGVGAITCTGGSQTLNGSGVATCQIATLAAGNHTITADYSGDANFTANNGTALTAFGGQNGNPQVVAKATPTVALGSSLNPSFVTQNVTFTGTVTAPAGVTGTPAGTLTFKDGGNPITCSNGGTAVQTLVSGSATCQTATLDAAGSPHVITADYVGDGSANGTAKFNNASGTLSPNQAVNKSNTTTALSAVPPGSSAPASPVVFTAAVTSQTAVTGPPAGKAQFLDGATPITCTGAGESGTSTGETLVSGSANCTTSTLTTAVHNITAQYTGDGSANGSATFNGSTSSALSYTVGSPCSNSFVVTSSLDTGPNTLREGIDTKVCDGGTITFTGVTLINLATPLSITRPMTINGPGAGTLTVSGNSVTRIFAVSSAQPVTISGMAMSTGKFVGATGAPGSGGGILNSGNLTLSNVTLSGNQATGGAGAAGAVGGDAFGGAIMNSGTLALNNSTVNGGNTATGGKGGDDNAANGNGGSAFGGGIYNTGTLTLNNTTVDSNNVSGGAAGAGSGTAGVVGNGFGGGIYNDATASADSVTIFNSTISANTASSNGGGIANVGLLSNASLAIINSTISGNMSNNDGGGLYNDSVSGTTTITSSTVTNNHADNDASSAGTGGGIRVVSGPVTLKDTIVAGNFATSLQVETATVTGGPITSGTLQKETITVSGGPVVNNGDIPVRVTAAGLVGSPKTFTVTLATNDTNDGVALKIQTALAADTDITNFFTVTNSGPDVVLEAKSATTDDSTMHISIVGSVTGINNAESVHTTAGVAPVTGVQQVETATVVGTITTGTNQVETLTVTSVGNLPLTGVGNASITVTAAGMTGSPKTILVALVLDDANSVATKIRAALIADADIGDVTTGFFTVSGSGPDVVLTAKVKAANDATMNISIDSCTCIGLNSVADSADTTPGAAPGTGNATVTVTAVGMNNTPKTLNVAVLAGDDASAVAGNIRAALSADPDIGGGGGFFTVSGSGADIVLTKIAAATDDASLNIATNNGTCSGLTPEPTSANTTIGVAPVTGVQQVETVTVSGGNVIHNGDILVRVTAAGLTGSPKTITVTLAANDTNDDVADKIQTALQADTDINGFFTITTPGANVVLIKNTATADDGTMHVSIIGFVTGINSSESVHTTAGASPGSATITVTASGMTGSPKTINVPVATGDTASDVAGKMRAALIADVDVNGRFLVTGAGAQIVLTRRVVEANDNTLNIATANGTATGLTDQATSADTKTGGTATPDDISGSVDTSVASSFNLIGIGGSGGLVNATNSNQVGVADPKLGLLLNNGGPTLTHKLLAASPALETGINSALTTLNGGIDNVTTTVNVTSAANIPAGITILVDTEQMVVTSKASNALTVTRGANGSTAASHLTGANVFPAFDQRGFLRTVNSDAAPPPGIGDDTDIGAYEMQTQPGVPNPPTLDPASDTGALGDNITADTTPTFNITGVVPGAVVELLRDGNPVTGTQSPVVSGSSVGATIQLTDPGAPAGTYTYSARQTVGGAPTSAQSSPLLTVTIDTTTPAAPDAPDLTDASDTGSSPIDNLTNATSPVFNIGNVTTGFTVQLLRDGGAVDSAVAVGSSILLTDASAPAGLHTYTSRQTNGVSATSSVTGLDVTFDRTAPAAPGTPDLQAGSDTGNNADNITKATTRLFDVVFTAEANSTVTLLRDGTPVTGATASGASSPQTLTDSEAIPDHVGYLYTVRHTDAAGNSSTSVTALSVTLDTTSVANTPDLQAASDSFGAGTTGTNSDNLTKTTPRSFDITGTENGALVELLRGGSSIASTTGTGGTVTLIDPTALADGPYIYQTRQTDIAGNVGTSSGLTVTIDTTPNAPGTPDLQPGSDAGASNTDNRTDNATHSFDISSLTGAFVELLRDGTPVSSVTAAGASVTLTDTASLADGLYHYSARQTDPAGNGPATSGTLDVTIDTTAPTVLTDVRASANPTSAASVDFTVTFSEPVTGVDTADFAAAGLGGLTGASITTVTPVNSSTYTVTVNTGTGDGSLRLDVIGNGTIKDAMNLVFSANFTTGEVYTVDRLNPFVTSITRANSSPTNTGTVDFTVTFSEPVTGVDNTDFALITSGLGGVPAVTLTSGLGTTWTVTASTGTGSGTIKLKLVDNNSIIDATAKTLAASPGTVENDGSFTPTDLAAKYDIDRTQPNVTVNQRGTPPDPQAPQADPVTGPTASTVINFTVVFSKPIAAGTFTNSDVHITGTALATVANVSQIAPNDGTTFNVAVEGMTQSGTVVVDIPAGLASDLAGNLNTASTSTDNTVTFFKDDFTTFEVNSLADTDDGACDPLGTGTGNKDCTLREAINAANADAGAETITFNSTVFAAPGPYTINLTGVLPDLSSDVTISGPGANVLTVKRNTGGNYRIFNISAGNVNVTINGLTISNGNAVGGGSLGRAGGIFNNSTGTVNVTNSTISGNSAAADAGGILNGSAGGTLNVTSSTISGNTAATDGGGLSIVNTSTVNITNSTISGNVANGNGGGVFTQSAALTISNSTITNNRADNDTNGTGTGGGLNRSSGTVTLRNTIIGGNFNDASPSTTADDINGAVNSEGYNLIQSTSGATISETLNAGSNITGLDPQLNALADNGGPTFTHSLQCTSPAIDKGKAFTLTTDQRGGVRPFDLADSVYPNAVGGDGSDIGAYETQSGGGCVPLAVAPVPAPTTNEDTPTTITLKGTYSQNFPLTFTITQSPAHGSLGVVSAPNCVFNLSMTCTATVNYSPSLNVNGLDSFKFKVSASGLDSDEADVNVTVNPVNDPPVANPQSVSTNEDTAVPIFLTGSDVDSSSLTFIIVTPPAHGSFGATTAPNLTYTPALNYYGPDSFTFKIDDGSPTNNLSNTATVSIAISPVNDPPVFIKGPDQNVLVNQGSQIVSPWATGIDAGLANEPGQLVSFQITNNTNPALFSILPAVSSSGILTYSAANNTVGTATITLVLKDDGGTANGGVDTSPPQSFVINVAKGNTTTALTSSVNPLLSGSSTTFTATVTANPPSSGTPQGTVNFLDGAAVIGTGTLNGSGVTTFVSSSLNLGSHTITAQYVASAIFKTSTSNAVTEVVKTNPTVSIGTSQNPASLGGNVTFTATVTPPAGVIVTPTGTVQFKDGGTNFGALANCAPGAGNTCTAQVTTSSLTSGTHTITADYSGDGNFNPASGTLAGGQVVGTLVRFNSATYNTSESSLAATITVERVGDMTSTVTVGYATPDDSAATPTILPCSTPGFVSSRCDFTAVSGTLQFGPGESTKTFTVLISQDNYVEGPESLTLTLSNVSSNALLSLPSTATLTIADDATEPSTNPIDDSQNFVRQQYHDFLDRDPSPNDLAGLAFWTNQIEGCGTDQACRDLKRQNVSAAFFLSIEFQQTGYYVYRTYKAGFGNLNPPSVPVPLRFSDFMPDTQEVQQGVVVGQGSWQAQLDANKQAYAREFVNRPQFLTRYPAATTATGFVDALNANAGSVLTAAERSALISELTPNPADATLRADVLMKVAENAVLQQQEFNRAFVLMQYFGYLRRNPDAAPESGLNFDGYNFWLNKLNSFGGDFIQSEMVKAFITSGEYRHRFGP